MVDDFNDVRDKTTGLLQSRPPKIMPSLLEVLQAHSPSKHGWPAMMPRDYNQAAQWWIGMQEPYRDDEKPNQMPVPTRRNTDPAKFRWITPYIDRLRDNLRLFLVLNNDQQRLILAAREDNIFWRGDDMETQYKQFGGITIFQHIIMETEKMRTTGVTAYQAQSMKRAKSKIRTMIAGEHA